MRFSTRLQKELVSEWIDFYFHYDMLKKQIKKIKARVISLALHLEMTGIQRPDLVDPETGQVQIEKLPEEKEFWKMVDHEVEEVNGFYKKQILGLEVQFLALVTKTYQKGLIPDFEPLKYTRLERELDRTRKKIFGDDDELSETSEQVEEVEDIQKFHEELAASLRMSRRDEEIEGHDNTKSFEQPNDKSEEQNGKRMSYLPIHLLTDLLQVINYIIQAAKILKYQVKNLMVQTIINQEMNCWTMINQKAVNLLIQKTQNLKKLVIQVYLIWKQKTNLWI